MKQHNLLFYESYSCFNSPLLLKVSYTPKCDYATTVQNDNNYIYYHEKLYIWLLSIVNKFHCPKCVAYRSANYIDRVLSSIPVKKEFLEGLSWLCFYLAVNISDLSNRKSICRYFADVYNFTTEQVNSFLQYILKILDFHLLTSCPYTLLYRILEYMNCLELYDEYTECVNIICKNYKCMTLDAETIVISTLLFKENYQILTVFLRRAAQNSQYTTDRKGIQVCLDCLDIAKVKKIHVN